MHPLFWLGHLIHVLIFVLSIFIVDVVIISTVGCKSELGFTSLSNYLREVTPPLYWRPLAPKLNKEILSGITLWVLLMYWWFVDWHCWSPIPSLFSGYILYFFLTHSSAGWRSALEEGALVRELTVLRLLGCLVQGVILSLMIFNSCTFFIMQILFVCMIFWSFSDWAGWRGR